MKIKLERNQARIIVSGQEGGLARSLSAKRELRRSGGKPAFLTPRPPDLIGSWQIGRRFSMLHKLITVVVALSLLSSSAMAQKKYERPAVKTPDEFRGADAVAPTDQTSIGDLKWFEVFKDDELQKLVRTAMVQNYDLRLAVARIDARTCKALALPDPISFRSLRLAPI